MPTKIYWVDTFENKSRLGIMPRPRGDNWLEDEIIHFKRSNVGMLVSLLEASEIYDLKLADEEEICNRYNIKYFNFPIPDRGIPSERQKVLVLIEKLVAEIEAGLSVVIHCRMGIGRSSIIAAAVLMRLKQKPVEIIDNISRVRGLKVPDTEEQARWLNSLGKL